MNTTTSSEEHGLDLVNLEEFLVAVRMAGVDLGANAKSRLERWQAEGLLPEPIRFADSGSYAGEDYYPRLAIMLVRLACLREDRGVPLGKVRDEINTALTNAILASPHEASRELRHFLREYGKKYGFFRHPGRILNALYELDTIRQRLRRDAQTLRAELRNRQLTRDNEPRARYADNCVLCGRALVGRGTKDKYALSEIRTVVPSLPLEYDSKFPFGVYACRSVRKCGANTLLYTLKLRTGRYLYGRH